MIVVKREDSEFSGNSMQAIEGNLSGFSGFSIGSIVRKVTSPVRKVARVRKKITRPIRKAVRKTGRVAKRAGRRTVKIGKKYGHTGKLTARMIHKQTGITPKQQLMMGAVVGTGAAIVGPAATKLGMSKVVGSKFLKGKALSMVSGQLESRILGGEDMDMIDPALFEQMKLQQLERQRLAALPTKKPVSVAKLIVPVAIGGAAILAATLA